MGSPESPGLTVRTDVRNGVARLAVVGELDISVVSTLEDQLDRVAGDGVGAALLDLRELTFMDSSGLHLLIRATDYAKQNGHRLAIVGVGGLPRRLLEITGTEKLLVDDADGMELIRRFTQPAPGDGASAAALDGPDA
jgi:anti-anti-sigma factor